MEIVRAIASAVIGGMLAPFSGRNALISLIPLSLLVGIGMLWVFRLTSNQAAIRKIKARLYACLYEMRLFTDEPALIWKAQWTLLTTNIKYLAMMLAPALVMSVPMLLLFGQLECFYGHAPLEPGREAIVTVQMKSAGAVPELRVPDGIAIESPPIRVDDGRQISWRIRALRAVSGNMQLALPGETVEKSVEAGVGPTYVSERRVSSVLDLLWYPAEHRLPAGPVDWIELRYPDTAIHALGMDLHWLVWLLMFSMISALLLKRRFKVSF
jgi:hypothetical protein